MPKTHIILHSGIYLVVNLSSEVTSTSRTYSKPMLTHVSIGVYATDDQLPIAENLALGDGTGVQNW